MEIDAHSGNEHQHEGYNQIFNVVYYICLTEIGRMTITKKEVHKVSKLNDPSFYIKYRIKKFINVLLS